MVTEHVFHSEGVRVSSRSEATEGCRLAVPSEWRTSRVGLHGGQGMAHPSQDWGAEQFSKQQVHPGGPAACLPHLGLESLAGDRTCAGRPGSLAGKPAALRKAGQGWE